MPLHRPAPWLWEPAPRWSPSWLTSLLGPFLGRAGAPSPKSGARGRPAGLDGRRECGAACTGEHFSELSLIPGLRGPTRCRLRTARADGSGCLQGAEKCARKELKTFRVSGTGTAGSPAPATGRDGMIS